MTAKQPTSRRPGRPKGGRRLTDRAQLLAAAERVIAADGPDVTMDAIAAEANVSKPIVYRTIGDREALVAALSESMVDRINAAVAAATAGSSSPRAGFEAAVRGFLGAVDAERNLFLFVNGRGPATDEYRRLVDRSAQRMIDVFTAARSSPKVDSATARTWAYAIVGAFQVVMLMWLRDEYCELDDVARDLTHLLWPGAARLGDGPPPPSDD